MKKSIRSHPVAKGLTAVNIFKLTGIAHGLNLCGYLKYPLFILSDRQVNMEGKTISELMINEQIRDKEVRVIGENGEQLGIMSSKEAQALADEAGVDLVKISHTAQPPLCRIVDYGKFKYEQMKREKEAKNQQHVVEIKEIRLTPNIDTNDLNTKINSAKKFLKDGDRVKVTLRFRGREMAHMQTSKHILDDFAEGLAEVAVIEKAPKVVGRSMTMFLAGKKN